MVKCQKIPFPLDSCTSLCHSSLQRTTQEFLQAPLRRLCLPWVWSKAGICSCQWEGKKRGRTVQSYKWGIWSDMVWLMMRFWCYLLHLWFLLFGLTSFCGWITPLKHAARFADMQVLCDGFLLISVLSQPLLCWQSSWDSSKEWCWNGSAALPAVLVPSAGKVTGSSAQHGENSAHFPLTSPIPTSGKHKENQCDHNDSAIHQELCWFNSAGLPGNGFWMAPGAVCVLL